MWNGRKVFAAEWSGSCVHKREGRWGWRFHHITSKVHDGLFRLIFYSEAFLRQLFSVLQVVVASIDGTEHPLNGVLVEIIDENAYVARDLQRLSLEPGANSVCDHLTVNAASTIALIPLDLAHTTARWTLKMRSSHSMAKSTRSASSRLLASEAIVLGHSSPSKIVRWRCGDARTTVCAAYLGTLRRKGQDSDSCNLKVVA